MRAIGTRHALSYGGNFRRNTFDISLAPDGDDRNEGGAYIQDEIFLGDHFRWVVGGRVDKFSSIDDAVFSPRTTLMFKPAAGSDVPRLVQPRVPRAVVHQQQHRRRRSSTPVHLCPSSARFVVSDAARRQSRSRAGDADRVRDRLQRASSLHGPTCRRAVYWNNTEDRICFTPVAAYSPANPPPGWPLPPAFVPPGALPSRIHVPEPRDDQGQGHRAWRRYLGEPLPQRVRQLLVSVDAGDRGLPGRHDASTTSTGRRRTGSTPGSTSATRRFLGNFSVNFTDESLLAGRARCAVCRHDGRVHAGQRRRSACAGSATDRHQPQADEPGQSGSAAAHLRRHHAAQVVGEVRFSF